jgi:hypothetical protein
LVALFGATDFSTFHKHPTLKKSIIVTDKIRRAGIQGHAGAPGAQEQTFKRGPTMLSKCANPECSAKFRYLHEGKVFRVEPDATSHPSKPPHIELAAAVPQRALIAKKPADRPEYFWLCSSCSERSTVGTDSRGVVLVPIFKPALAARAVSAGAAAA